jgi:hypothetical protein
VRTTGGHALPTLASVLAPLSPRGRQYVLGILALSPAQLRAAFGTNLAPLPAASNTTHGTTAPISSGVASPILPTCGSGPCWRGTTTRRSAHRADYRPARPVN